MQQARLHNAHVARPFVPFFLELADGQKLRVSHPEFMAYWPGSRTASVWMPEGYHKIVDVMLIVAIDFGPGGAKRKRRRAG